ncbi:MAG: hypothetical protein KIT31_42135 [Deltaproteobacteria bacterium]|nr:hypothetical protein [Deltaproteobacteria bacterium]
MRSILTIVICAALAACTHQGPGPAVAVVKADLAVQREISLQRLRAYAEAGVFPLDERGRPTSIFRDGEGRLCAMAFLIDASGRRDLVDEVVRTNNRLKLAEVKDGPLMDWMLSSGLTQEEIALIQGELVMDYVRFENPNHPEPMQNQIVVARARNEIKRRLAVRGQQLVAQRNTSLELAAQRAPSAKVAAANPRP